jgi:hypothetical protein
MGPGPTVSMCGRPPPTSEQGASRRGGLRLRPTRRPPRLPWPSPPARRGKGAPLNAPGGLGTKEEAPRTRRPNRRGLPDYPCRRERGREASFLPPQPIVRRTNGPKPVGAISPSNPLPSLLCLLLCLDTEGLPDRPRPPAAPEPQQPSNPARSRPSTPEQGFPSSPTAALFACFCRALPLWTRFSPSSPAPSLAVVQQSMAALYPHGLPGASLCSRLSSASLASLRLSELTAPHTRPNSRTP